jgi:predicted AAA+ superfamily ATPase
MRLVFNDSMRRRLGSSAHLHLATLYRLADLPLGEWTGARLFRDPGRDRALEQLVDVLRDFAEGDLAAATGYPRLLTGPRGIGKSFLLRHLELATAPV